MADGRWPWTSSVRLTWTCSKMWRSWRCNSVNLNPRSKKGDGTSRWRCCVFLMSAGGSDRWPWERGPYLGFEGEGRVCSSFRRRPSPFGALKETRRLVAGRSHRREPIRRSLSTPHPPSLNGEWRGPFPRWPIRPCLRQRLIRPIRETARPSLTMTLSSAIYSSLTSRCYRRFGLFGFKVLLPSYHPNLPRF